MLLYCHGGNMRDVLNELKDSLGRLISSSDNVFIIAHNSIDLDAIGSIIGLALISKSLGKEPYVIVDDEVITMEACTRKVFNKIKNDFNIIKGDEVLGFLTGNDLLIATDVNKTEMISIGDKVELFKNVIIIDHHKENENTIKTDHKYIDLSLSSICEVVTQLLDRFKVAFDSNYANYLLAGIMLDTNKFTKKTTDRTFEIASNLMAKGANIEVISNLFVEDYEHDRLIQKLIDNTQFFTYNVAVAKDMENSIYSTEDLAKAADYLLKYNVTLSFAIGRVKPDTIGISARSKGPIDISKIMEDLGGGGNQHSAAAKISFQDVESVEEIVEKVLSLDYLIEEENMDKVLDGDTPKIFERKKK